VYIERARVQKSVAVVTFSVEVQRAEELGVSSLCWQSRGQRHQRGWYGWGRCVWYSQRRGVSH